VSRSIYVAEHGAGAGKSAVALGIAELLSRRVPELGVFRPLVLDADRDDTIELIRERYGVGVPADELYGVTYAEAAAMVADGRREDLFAHIVDRYRAVARRCGAVVVVGSDFDDGHHHQAGGMSRELAFNARLATEFGSVVAGPYRVPQPLRPQRDGRGRRHQPGAVGPTAARPAGAVVRHPGGAHAGGTHRRGGRGRVGRRSGDRRQRGSGP
jgi:hypothetical protein